MRWWPLGCLNQQFPVRAHPRPLVEANRNVSYAPISSYPALICHLIALILECVNAVLRLFHCQNPDPRTWDAHWHLLLVNLHRVAPHILHLASPTSYHLTFAFLWGYTSVLTSLGAKQMGSLQVCPDKDSGLHLVLLTSHQAHLDKIERGFGDRGGSELILVIKEKEKINKRLFTSVSKIQDWGSRSKVS